MRPREGTILYFFDPLCGWCYGFSPVMEAFHQRYADRLDFEVIAGGMVRGDRVGPIGEVAGYIHQAYKTVEERTGVRFGQGFLEGILQPGTEVFSSVPGAIALAVFKQFRHADAVPFAGAMQRAIYDQGMAPTDVQGYGKLAAPFGWEEEAFVAHMNQPAAKEAAEEGFQQTGAIGVQGFPTVIYFNDTGKVAVLTQGYIPLESLEAELQAAMTDAE